MLKTSLFFFMLTLCAYAETKAIHSKKCDGDFCLNDPEARYSVKLHPSGGDPAAADWFHLTYSHGDGAGIERPISRDTKVNLMPFVNKDVFVSASFVKEYSHTKGGKASVFIREISLKK